MEWKTVVIIALEFPETVEAISYGEPSLKVRKKLLTRYRVADHSIVLMDVPAEERAFLIEHSPDIFFSEPHYQSYDIVLAKLQRIQPEQVAAFIERRWRNLATKAAIIGFDS
jgi:hypothetical protein